MKEDVSDLAPPNWLIAIDGPVAAGKTTVARLLATRLGYQHIDSGTMYRALGWSALERGCPLDDEASLLTLLGSMRLELSRDSLGTRVTVDDRDVTCDIRDSMVDEAASRVSVHPQIREVMVQKQQAMAEQGGVVMDGRDIGTIVLPHAHIKFYLDATLQERGRRRSAETGGEGELYQTIEAIAARDRRDVERAAAPLRKAQDAIVIDTTDLTPTAVVERMIRAIQAKARGG